MNILLCPDKFKGSLTAFEICELLSNEISLHLPHASFEICPLADGGEGSLDILSQNLDMKRIDTETVDSLGRSIVAPYYIYKNSAYIELAHTAGLVQLSPQERNPLVTSTYGTGIQIKDAIARDVDTIYLFIGGSATNDGGLGIAHALGFLFYDDVGERLKPEGKSLLHISKIERPRIESDYPNIIVCCDVTNLPYGPQGAANVYAAQKGASSEDIEFLEMGMVNLCDQIQRFNGIDCSLLEGGGAAGGVGVCLTALMGAEMKSGMQMISEILELDKKIKASDVIISGEGKLDHQSLQGKVISGVAALCQQHGKNMFLVVGQNALSNEDLSDLNIQEVYSIMGIADDLEDAMANGRKYMRKIGSQIALDIRGNS